MATVKKFFNLWLTLMLLWLILNASLASAVVLSGAVICAGLGLMFLRYGQPYAEINWTPLRIYHYFLYLGVFTRELLVANLNLARIVTASRIDIHPGIVEIKTELRSRIGRLALANSITLTPGTLVVDIKDDTLFIHWIDVRVADPVGATQAIAGRFEQHLKVIYG